MDGVNDFTIGNIRKLIIGFYFPMLMTNMFQQLYSFVDTAIVGKGLGDNALASVGNMSSLSFLIIGFSIGLANGFSVIIAQCFWEKNFEKLRHNLAAAIKLAVIIMIILTLLSLLFLKSALIGMNTDDTLMKNSLIYGYISFGGLSASILYNMSAFILRALGDSRTPFKAIIVSSLLNIILDILFIFGLKTGVEGAAIATVISQFVSAFVNIIKIKKIQFIKLEKKYFKNPFKVYITLLKNGIPMAFMNSVTAIGCMVVQANVNSMGVDYTVAYSACSKYLNLFMQPACTAGNAMSAFTGQSGSRL